MKGYDIVLLVTLSLSGIFRSPVFRGQSCAADASAAHHERQGLVWTGLDSGVDKLLHLLRQIMLVEIVLNAHGCAFSSGVYACTYAFDLSMSSVARRRPCNASWAESRKLQFRSRVVSAPKPAQ